MKKISTIKANKGFDEFGGNIRKKRVCVYCRVSTHELLQKESLEAQVNHYTTYVENNSEWEFVGVYADEGISGKNKKQRNEFMRMVRGAENGNIDLVITKSISRFARNTSECIETVRHLKSLNVGVYFEKENINTLDAESELMLSILSSVAEEELLSTSQNMKWSITRKFKQGKVVVQTERFMGYDKDEHGNLVINEEQAKIVRKVFEAYIGGQGTSKIAKALEYDGIERTTGGTNWSASAILGMLKNEKYSGNALLQKTVTLDSISLKRKKNQGEAPQYYVENSHPAIISKEQFQQVQVLMEQRSRAKGNIPEIAWKYSQRYCFTSKLECGKCGKSFKRTVHNSRSSNCNYYWACCTYIEKGIKSCDVGTIKEDTIKRLFIRIVNKLISDKTPLENHLKELQSLYEDDLTGSRAINFEDEITKLLQQEREMFLLKVRGYFDKELFQKEHMELIESIKTLQDEKMALQNTHQTQDKSYQSTIKILTIINNLQRNTKFEEDLFETFIEKIVVKEREALIFQLQGGLQFEEKYTFKYGADIV